MTVKSKAYQMLWLFLRGIDLLYAVEALSQNHCEAFLQANIDVAIMSL